MKNKTLNRYSKTFMILLLMFIITRMVILSSIAFIKTGPFSPDRNIDFRYLMSEVTLTIPHRFQMIYFQASTETTDRPLSVEVRVNQKPIGTMKLDPSFREYVFNTRDLVIGETNKVSFHTLGQNSTQAWQLWNMMLDTIPPDNMIKNPYPVQGVYLLETQKNRNQGRPYLTQGLTQWDAGWYQSIAESGYDFDGNYHRQQNIGLLFFYPLSAKLIHSLTGVSYSLSLIWASHLFLLIGLFFIYEIARKCLKDDTLAYLPVLLLLIHPFQVFLSAGYSESMFICFSAAALYLLLEKRYFWAAVIGGAACGIRAVGVVFPILLIANFYLTNKSNITIKLILGLCVRCIVSLWGILFNMVYMYFHFQDPFVYFKIQKAWVYRETLGLDTLGDHFLSLLTKPPYLLNPELMGFLLIISIFLYSLYKLIQHWKANNSTEILLALFSVSILFIPLYDRFLYAYPQGRFSLVAFPVWILLCRKMSLTKAVILSCLAVLFIFQMAVFAMRFSCQQTPF